MLRMPVTLLPDDTPTQQPTPAGGAVTLLPDDSGPNALEQGLGIGTRGAIHGLTALPFGMPFDVGTKIGNLVNKGISAITGQQVPEYPSFSQQLDSALTALGMPEARTPTQRVAESATAGLVGGGAIAKGAEALAGAADPMTAAILELMSQKPGLQAMSGATGGAASQTTAEAGGGPIAQTAAGFAGSLAPGLYTRTPAPAILTSEQQALRQKALDLGYDLTPFQLTGKRWQGNLEAAMRQMPSTSVKMQEIDALNAANTNQLTSNALNAAGGAIDQGTAGAAAMGGMQSGIEGAANATGQGYQQLLGNTPVNIASMKPTIAALQAKYAALPQDIQGGPAMTSLKTLTGDQGNPGYLSQNPVITGQTAQDLRSAYGSASNAAFKGGNNDTGKLYADMKGAVDDAIEQSLPKSAQGQFAALNDKYGLDMAISNLMPKNQETFLNQLYRGAPDQFYTFLGVADPRSFSQVARGFITRTIENATSSETGNVSATKLGAAIDKMAPDVSGRADVMKFLGGPQSNVLRDVGQIGQNVLQEGAPNSGTAQRMMFQGLMKGAGLASGGALGSLGGTVGAIAGAGLGDFLIPSLIQKLYLSGALRPTLTVPPTQGAWQMPSTFSGTLGGLAGRQ